MLLFAKITGMATLPVVRRVSMRLHTADILRNALREGRLKFGDDLSEQHLAAQMQVSRGPVREALLVLAEEGLVTHSPNRGFSVPQFTHADKAKIDEVRLVLEALALRLACGRLAPEEFDELERLKDEIVRLFEARNPARDNTEMAFHWMIWRRSGNDWLEGNLTRMMIPYFTYCRFLPDMPPADLTTELIHAQHQRYIDFLRGECGFSAEECVRFHLRL